MVPLQGHPYAWPAEDLLLTTITKGSCKTCGFFEDRLLPFVRVGLAGTVLLHPAHQRMHVSVEIDACSVLCLQYTLPASRFQC